MLHGVARWTAGVVPLVVAGGLLLGHDVPPPALAGYGLYLLLGVLGPGLLVSRAVLGRGRMLLADLGTGGAVGLVLTLGAWAAASVVGVQGQLRWWPLTVYGLFAAVPSLRRHLVPRRYPERLTAPVAWVLSLSVALAALGFRRTLEQTAPLTGTTQWPADMSWHLGVVELFTRQLGPQDPQVAGEHLAYHWFSAADMAAASLATGIEPWLVLSRLWVLPVVALTVAMLLAALREITPRAPQAAAVAAVVIAAPAGLEVLPWLDVPWDPVFAPLSPSQNYSYPFLLLTELLVVRVLRGGRWRAVLPLGLLFLLSPGVKSANLPVLVAGLLFASAATLGRSGGRRLVGVLALAVTAGAAGSLVIGAGGATGARFQLFAVLRRLEPYRESIGMDAAAAAAPGGLLPPGLDVPGVPLVLGLLVLATVLKYVWVLPGLVLLGGPRRRRDPVPWVLAGIGLAGWVLMLLVDQSGASQVYFAGAGTVAWAVLAGWGLATLLDASLADSGPGPTARRVLVAVAVGAAATGVIGWCAARVASRVLPAADALPPADRTDVAGAQHALATGLVPAVLLLLAGVGWVALTRRTAARRARGLALGVALLAGSLVLNPWFSAPDDEVPAPTRWAVSPAELDAARWIRAHAGPHDIVATNVHCLTPRRDGQCDARAFWVSALTGHRTEVGGWAYLDQTRAMGATVGRPNARQPFYDPGRLALNDELFVSPTPALVDLFGKRGVRWVYADRRRAPVAPGLDEVATLVHENDEVEVYRLPRPTTDDR